jgi:hypothetical protein
MYLLCENCSELLATIERLSSAQQSKLKFTIYCPRVSSYNRGTATQFLTFCTPSFQKQAPLKHDNDE